MLDDLIRNIEKWKDALIENEALPINLLVSLTVSVSWLLRCKAELTTRIDALVEKSGELTNNYLLRRSRELNKALLAKMNENAVLKAVESENDKLKKREEHGDRTALCALRPQNEGPQGQAAKGQGFPRWPLLLPVRAALSSHPKISPSLSHLFRLRRKKTTRMSKEATK